MKSIERKVEMVVKFESSFPETAVGDSLRFNQVN
jgi:hypothetical protein